MKSVVRAPVLAAILMLFLTLPRMGLGAIWLASLQLVLGVVAALVIEGSFSWIGFIAGTISPLALAWLGASHAPWAVAIMCFVWLSPRIWRCSSTSQMGRLAGLSAFASIMAGFVSTSFTQADLTTSLAASLFSGAALALTTMLFRVDSPCAHALVVASRSLESPLREKLQEAVEWKRQEELGLDNKKNNKTAWKNLLHSLDQRIALRAVNGAQAQAAQAQLDATILQQIATLTAGPKPQPAPEASPKTVDPAIPVQEVSANETVPSPVQAP